MSGVLESPRLRLRPVAPDDRAFFHRQWNDPQVGRFLWDGAPVAAETAEAVLASSAESFASKGYGLWHVSRRDDGAPLGFCGLRVAPDSGRVELLYALEPACWGQGYATEAAHAVLDYAFSAVGLESVIASTNPDNTPSWRVLEKLGMTPTGRRYTETEELVDYALTRPARSPAP
jgi:[ribosomal protein S5]-alanine N-acetyltransferase